MTSRKDAPEPKQSKTGPQSPTSATGSFAAPPAAGTATTGSYPQLNTKPLFKLMVEKKASDLFFTCNAPI